MQEGIAAVLVPLQFLLRTAAVIRVFQVQVKPEVRLVDGAPHTVGAARTFNRFNLSGGNAVGIVVHQKGAVHRLYRLKRLLTGHDRPIGDNEKVKNALAISLLDIADKTGQLFYKQRFSASKMQRIQIIKFGKNRVDMGLEGVERHVLGTGYIFVEIQAVLAVQVAF